MKLNCKKDDFAYVKKVTDERYNFLRQRFVRVKTLILNDDQEFAWVLHEPIKNNGQLRCRRCGMAHRDITDLPDDWLQPLPGDAPPDVENELPQPTPAKKELATHD